MNGVTRVPTGESSDDLRRIRFRRSKSDRLDPSALSRQSKIALLAFQACGTREAACAFMNDMHAALGGRPIEIAGQSEVGFASVRAALPALQVGSSASGSADPRFE